MSQKKLSPEERFWSFCSPDPNSGCWIWTGAIHGRLLKYGSFGYEGGTIQAHHAAWIFYRGEIPSGMLVCHKCDVPSCVNPDHLFLGTYRDNVMDMIAKGRAEHLKRFTHTILSKDQVTAILKDNRKQPYIAKEYKVTRSCICAIKTRRNWKSIGFEERDNDANRTSAG